jgi:hypothetical protein
MIINFIHVLISNICCRLATWKRVKAAPALTLGYGYDIEDDEE